MYEGKIPFDQYGTPLSYVESWNEDKAVWKDNEPFVAHLRFEGFQRMRSAAHAVYRSVEDESWEAVMFLTELGELISSGYAPMYLTGRFCHVKRGTNFGIKYLGHEEA